MTREQQLFHILQTYAPGGPGTPEYQQFVEEMRRLMVLSQAQFRRDQQGGNFTDGTGDAYLQVCLQTIPGA